MKFCISCGNQIPDNMKFCPRCGSRQPEPVQSEKGPVRRPSEDPYRPRPVRAEWGAAAGAAGAGAAAGSVSGAPKTGLKKFLPLIVAAAVVVIALIVALAVVRSRPVKIDLEKYTEVRFEGYNGAGSASVDFDYNTFEYDIAKAMAKKGVISKDFVKNESPATIRDLLDYNFADGARVAMAAEELRYDLDKWQGLSNGDEVTVSYRYSNKQLEKYKIRFAGKEKKIKVKDLGEIEKFDAFAGIDVTFSGGDGYGQLSIEKTGTDEVFDQLAFYPDREYDLSNGDTVTITVEERYGNDFSDFGRTYGRIPEELSKTYTVEGLQTVGTFDAFEALNITLQGIAPNGEIYLENTDTSNGLTYSADQYGGLSNGDTITITVSPSYSDTFGADYVSAFGQVPETTTRTFSVEGLPEYVRSISEISQDCMDAMKAQTQDNLNAHAASSYGSDEKLTGSTYKGAYLLTLKDTEDTWSDQNLIYLIYEVKTQVTNDNDSREITYYYYTCFANVLKQGDGSCTVDLTYSGTPGNTFDIEIGERNYYYYGYASLDALVNDVITARAAEYSSETNIGA